MGAIPDSINWMRVAKPVEGTDKPRVKPARVQPEPRWSWAFGVWQKTAQEEDFVLG